MYTSHTTFQTHRRGVAYIVSLIILAVFSAIAVAFAVATDMNAQKSANTRQTQAAHLEAESGLSLMHYVTTECKIPIKASGQDLLDALNDELSALLDGTGNLAGTTVGYDGAKISVPKITSGNGRSFSAELGLVEDLVAQLRVTGHTDSVNRRIRINYQMNPGDRGVFDYGVATRGTVIMSGNAAILAANPGSDDADMLSTYDGATKPAFDLSGNAALQGDIATTDPYATVKVTDGFTGDINKGVGNVDFPDVDTSMFEPFATNVITTGSTGPGQTFTNVRIKAGTNPVFDADTVLQGVCFIEAPNQVTFAGKLTVRGVIVTQDAGDDAYDQNWISFSGQVDSYSVATLPGVPEFHELRQLTGSFLLAPGFTAKFSGQFGTVNGAMAAEKFEFSGQASGTVHGTVISYGDVDFVPSGQGQLTIDRSGCPEHPAGFDIRSRLSLIPDSYEEY